MAVSPSFDEIIFPQLEKELLKIASENEQKYIDISEDFHQMEHLITKRSFPKIHVKGKKKRTCQNMNGILGGSNAFNFMSFVAGVITLVSNIFVPIFTLKATVTFLRHVLNRLSM